MQLRGGDAPAGDLQKSRGRVDPVGLRAVLRREVQEGARAAADVEQRWPGWIPIRASAA